MMPGKALFVAAWGLANLGLAGVLGAQVDWGRAIRLEAPPLAKPAQGTVEAQVLPDFTLSKLDKSFKQTLERPLTVPTRRPAPPPPPPPPPPKPTMQKGQFQLIGVISVPDASYALLRENAGGRLRQVALGQSINGLRLDKVTESSVELTQYDDREVLSLKVMPSSKAMPAPARPGAVAAPVVRGKPLAPGIYDTAPARNAPQPTGGTGQGEAGATTGVPTGSGGAAPASPSASPTAPPPPRGSVGMVGSSPE